MSKYEIWMKDKVGNLKELGLMFYVIEDIWFEWYCVCVIDFIFCLF